MASLRPSAALPLRAARVPVEQSRFPPPGNRDWSERERPFHNKRDLCRKTRSFHGAGVVDFLWDCTGSSFPLMPITSIVLRFRVCEPWQGTFYVDNVRLVPK